MKELQLNQCGCIHGGLKLKATPDGLEGFQAVMTLSPPDEFSINYDGDTILLHDSKLYINGILFSSVKSGQFDGLYDNCLVSQTLNDAGEVVFKITF